MKRMWWEALNIAIWIGGFAAVWKFAHDKGFQKGAGGEHFVHIIREVDVYTKGRWDAIEAAKIKSNWDLDDNEYGQVCAQQLAVQFPEMAEQFTVLTGSWDSTATTKWDGIDRLGYYGEDA